MSGPRHAGDTEVAAQVAVFERQSQCRGIDNCLALSLQRVARAAVARHRDSEQKFPVGRSYAFDRPPPHFRAAAKKQCEEDEMTDDFHCQRMDDRFCTAPPARGQGQKGEC